jgi:O-antigen ligase
VLRRCFLLHIPIDVILIKYYRSIGVGWDYTGGEMWIGLTKQKNSLGQILMTAATYFSWDSLRKLRESLLRLNVNILYILMILWLLIGPGEGRSITSISALLVGVGVVVGLHFAPKSRKILDRFFIKSVAVLLFFLMVLGLGMGAFHADWTFFGGFLEMTGREQTLTGRTELWMDMLEIAKENPISGVGYGSFWIGDKANNLWERHIWGPQEGHNGYLDVYIELGIIGLLLFGFFLFGTFRVIRDMLIEDFEFGVFRMAFFIMILVHNLAESSFLRSDHNLWFILVLIAINIPDAIRVGDDSADPDAA